MARKKSTPKQSPATRKSYNLRSKAKEIETVKVVPKNTKIKRGKPKGPPTPTENVQRDPCAICLGTNNYKQNRTVDCGHTFHTRCINSWFRVAPSCPVCRKPIQKRRPPTQQCPPAPEQRTPENMSRFTFCITVYRPPRYNL